MFSSTGTEHCKAAKVQGLVAVQITYLSVGDSTPQCGGRQTSVWGIAHLGAGDGTPRCQGSYAHAAQSTELVCRTVRCSMHLSVKLSLE